MTNSSPKMHYLDYNHRATPIDTQPSTERATRKQVYRPAQGKEVMGIRIGFGKKNSKYGKPKASNNASYWKLPIQNNIPCSRHRKAASSALTCT
jgi:hypothetical protein